MFENSCEIFYKMISRRICEIKKYKGLRNIDIYPQNENLVSAMINNRRHPSKNKYLIPANAINEIANNLSLSSPVELILGSTAEKRAYAGYLFHQLFLDLLDTDILDIEIRESKTKLELLLSDYIPYAKSAFFVRMLDEKGDIAKFLIEQKYHSDVENCVYELDCSIARLSNLFQDDFLTMLTEMFQKQKNLTKLNERLSRCMSTKMIPFMLKNRKDYLIGTDAQTMLHRAYSRLIHYTEYELKISPEEIGYHENDYNYMIRHMLDKLFEADVNYVEALAKIQFECEEQPDIAVFKNKWKPEMCLKSKRQS